MGTILDHIDGRHLAQKKIILHHCMGAWVGPAQWLGATWCGMVCQEEKRFTGWNTCDAIPTIIGKHPLKREHNANLSWIGQNSWTSTGTDWDCQKVDSAL
jgi:hypothetical protein